MTGAPYAAAPAKDAVLTGRWRACWQHIVAGVILSFVVLYFPQARDAGLVPTIPIASWISDAMRFALNDLVVLNVEFKTITRALANLIDVPADFFQVCCRLGSPLIGAMNM